MIYVGSVYEARFTTDKQLRNDSIWRTLVIPGATCHKKKNLVSKKQSDPHSKNNNAIL